MAKNKDDDWQDVDPNDDWQDVDISAEVKPVENVAAKSSFADEALQKAKEFGQATVENLSGLGAMAGGTIGGLTAGPPGAIAGAGIGGYAGEAAKNLINRYVEPEKAPKTEMEYLTGPALAGSGAVAGE